MSAKINPKPYPFNLLSDLFALYAESDHRPDDIEGTVEYALYTLKPRERQALVWRYRDGWTLQAIADEMGITASGAGMLRSSAFRKLRHPTRSKLLFKGINAYWNARLENAYTNGYEKGYNRAKEEELTDAEQKLLAAEQVSLEEMGLSTRSYNALHRRGINTLADILKLTRAHLKNTENLGRKSVEEITEIIKARGYSLADE